MREVINMFPKFISYDLTNDENLYIEALESLKQKNDYVYVQPGTFEEIIEEIKNPKAVEDGKYKIPREFLYEEIRYIISGKQIGDYGYSKNNGIFSEEDGKKIENMYREGNLYISTLTHRNSITINEYKKTKDSISKNGLRCSKGYNNWIDRIIRGKNYGDVFTIILDIISEAGRVIESNYIETCVLIQIPNEALDPETDICVFGSDEFTIEKCTYLLPEYIKIFSIADDDGVHLDPIEIKPEERKQYKYHFKNQELKPIEATYEDIKQL